MNKLKECTMPIKSEFYQNGFDRSPIASFCLKKYSSPVNDSIEARGFYFAKLVKAFKSGHSSKDMAYHKNISIYKELLLGELESNDISKEIQELQKAIENWHKANCWSNALAYVNKFYDFSKNIVFYPNNVNLQNVAFRRSPFLKDLLCFATIHRGTHMRPNFIEYSLEDPFICAALIRIACNFTRFENELNSNKDPLTGIRQSLFCRLSENELNRTVHINGETHRVFLNRHTSKVYAIPYSRLSSVEDIKPIRLFEKIKSYLEQEIIEATTEILERSICLIGHTELSGVKGNKASPYNRELYDLVNAIGYWYASKASKIRLNLTITNYVNEDDAFYFKKQQNDNTKISYENESGCSIKCEVQNINYTQYFAFSSQKIENVIEENDITFILDCPWLYLENYEIKQDTTLESYCKEINSDKLSCPECSNCDQIHNDDCRIDQENNIKNRRRQMKYLDAQYNRIMASSTSNAGDVCRVFNDSLVTKIANAVKKKKNVNKVVYVFSSESVGLQYSCTATYPLVRSESYEGKNFTIFQFCNYKVKTLDVSKRGMDFKISLWSTFKYISIMYAYDKFKAQILNCIEKDFKMPDPMEYYTLCRNICTRLTVEPTNHSNTLFSLKVQVCYNPEARSIVEKWVKSVDKDKSTDDILNKIGNLIKPIIETLYKQVLFNKKYINKAGDSRNGFGDEHIRTAFCMNLYSGISNVDEMLFWHFYRNACTNRNFDKYKVSFNSTFHELSAQDSQKPDRGHYFMDKRLYDLILQQLDYRDTINIALQSMFYEEQMLNCYEVDSTPGSLLSKMLSNIVMVTEDVSKCDVLCEKIHSNAQHALRDLKKNY